MIAAPKTVPTRYFSLLLDIVARQGVDVSRLLALAKIDASRFEGSNGALAPRDVDALVEAAYTLTGREDLGFELGRTVKLNSHDLMGYAMLSCRDLDHFMQFTSRYYHFINALFAMKYRRGARQGEVTFNPVVAMPLATMHFALEAMAVSFQDQVQVLFRSDLAYEIRMGMSSPAHAARYAALAPVRFHFDDAAPPGIRVLFEGEMLDRPLPMPSPALVQQIEQRLHVLQRRPAPDGEWGPYIAMLLRETRGQQLTLTEIAQRLRISDRTIDRNLKKEGLSFRLLSQKVRLERAQDLLRQPDATLQQVSMELGFGDVANFSRAFRRDAGVTPKEYLQIFRNGGEEAVTVPRP
ncbi:helix-turn-helix transcriptional regulator [Variovorax ginsengisoli]|uniref:AraC family transcriptional regulator ligand-binding domain-containing protein n=1 Tax=Variovorax ginsengisoli TaxID=363844 RepID=A0ABT8SGA0_9BURK|nr:AraC family transcriptional regulator [Variovorax ginsengisoli]MDN8618744.1 AraC family transcriptional regulator ligand-binding domain-containing protein [Variovorax ginsengisoli]MDO1537914.1 AraC family transcriptional regulator ligand-binding domain-containing protein [Variovorax ginsengisoli]